MKFCVEIETMRRLGGWRSRCVTALLCAVSSTATGQLTFDHAPIHYSTTTPVDAIAKLQARLDDGDSRLAFDKEHGYLKSVLEELQISVSTQLLVFSKTSLQQHAIFPWSPRAIYYNDESYVGWVPGAAEIEISTVDPRQGAIFYTLRQRRSERPRFIRDRGNCLSCHATRRTQSVPGHLVRSVYPSSNGLPHFHAGTFRSNHSLPLSQRWGGWFVTGTHGLQRHMGNVVAPDRDRPTELDIERGANVVDLKDRTRIERYLTKHSDIVALLVLDHQVDMHNLITRANYDAREALHSAAVMNKAFGRPRGHLSDSYRNRLDRAVERLLRYMLFVDEARLTDTTAGTSDFAAGFSALGPRDRFGRSLRDLDLERRLLRYPCSYLIYSDAFRALPTIVKNRVYGRLLEILISKDRSETYAHLSRDDREAILQILLDTHDELANYAPHVDRHFDPGREARF